MVLSVAAVSTDSTKPHVVHVKISNPYSVDLEASSKTADLEPPLELALLALGWVLACTGPEKIANRPVALRLPPHALLELLSRVAGVRVPELALLVLLINPPLLLHGNLRAVTSHAISDLSSTPPPTHALIATPSHVLLVNS